jgi:outer membrane protein assembly factor BamB
MSGDPLSPNSKGVYCLNAGTGDLAWKSLSGHDNVYPKQLFFNDTHVFDVGSLGYVSIFNKTSGLFLETTDPPSSLNGIARPIGKVNNEYAAYFVPNGDIGLIEMAHPQTAQLTYMNGLPQILSYISDNGKLYAQATGTTNTLEVFCVDPLNGVEWRKTFTRNTPVVTFEDYTVFDFKIKGDRIYLFAGFHIEGTDCVPNEARTVTPPGSTVPIKLRYPSVIVMSKSSGGIIKQCKKLPVGPYETKVYNFLIN